MFFPIGLPAFYRTIVHDFQYQGQREAKRVDSPPAALVNSLVIPSPKTRPSRLQYWMYEKFRVVWGLDFQGQHPKNTVIGHFFSKREKYSKSKIENQKETDHGENSYWTPPSWATQG